MKKPEKNTALAEDSLKTSTATTSAATASSTTTTTTTTTTTEADSEKGDPLPGPRKVR